MGVLEDAIREHIELRRRHGAAEDELRDQEAEALGPARREVDDEVDAAEEAPPAGEAGEPADQQTRLAEAPALEEEGSFDHLNEPDEDPPPGRAAQVEPFGVGEREEEAESVASLDLDPPLREAAPGAPVTELPVPLAEPLEEEPTAEELPPEEQPPEGFAREELTPPREEPPPEDELPPEELPPEELAPPELPAEDLAPEELPPEELPPEGLAPEAPPPPRAPDAPPAEDAGDDVLEETPDFLSETPEHDRLWFEQKPPRDFDFD